uniref:Uncharacterized protein n=1 Tax=Oryza barthii TaxID=65489 RepID=A0A0D3H5V3_9ORYZ
MVAEATHEVLRAHGLAQRYSGQVISDGRIASRSGVSAQDLFIWFPVCGIRIDVPSSSVIYFDVGVVFKHFPLAVFEAPPPCT